MDNDSPPQSSTQQQNQGDNNNFDAPLSPSTFNVPPVDQGDDLPPFFSPLPSIAETFCCNTCSISLEDELNPPYQYQYLGWHGIESNNLFTPWFQPSPFAPIESSEDTSSIVLPTLLPQPPPPSPVVSGGGGKPSEPHSVPIIVDQLDDNNEAKEAPPSSLPPIGIESVSTTMILPSSQAAPAMEEPNSAAMVVASSFTTPAMAESSIKAMVVAPFLPPPTMTESSTDAMVVTPSLPHPGMVESSAEAMVVALAPSPPRPAMAEFSVEATVVEPFCPPPSVVEPSSSTMVVSLSFSSPTIVEPGAEARVIAHSSPLPAMVEPNSEAMVVELSSSALAMAEFSAEAIVVAPSSPPPSMEDSSAEAMVVALSSLAPVSAEPSSGAMVIAPNSFTPPSLADSSFEAMVARSSPASVSVDPSSEVMVVELSSSPLTIVESSVEAMVVASSSTPPIGEAANTSAVMYVESSKSNKRKSQRVDSSVHEDGAHESYDVGFRQGVPTVSEMELLERFLRLGTKRDSLRPLIIRVNGERDVMTVITSIAEEKGSNLLILGTVGTLSTVQLLQEGKPTTYEGDFIIISLSGIILLPKDGDTQSTSQLSVSVVGADGNVFGGPVHGRLIAASPMQMVGLTLVRKGRKPRGLKAKLNIPNLQMVTRSMKNGGKAPAKGKKPESEEANRSEHGVLKELNENITKCDETKIDEKLAEYMDAELQLAPDASGDVPMVDVIHGQVK